jgi:hypothetical protein
MQPRTQKPLIDGDQLIRQLRRSPKHLAKLCEILRAAGPSDREIVAAMAQSRILISPTKLIGGRSR